MFASKFQQKAPVSMIASKIVMEKEAPELLQEGVTNLVITDVLDLGTVHSVYGDRKKLVVVMESEEPSVKYPGKNKTLRATMTASLHTDSNFSRFIRALGFDINGGKFHVALLHNIAFQGNVVNKAAEKTGVVYSNLGGIIPGTVKGVMEETV